VTLHHYDRPYYSRLVKEIRSQILIHGTNILK
jgi:hypothetical protein